MSTTGSAGKRRSLVIVEHVHVLAGVLMERAPTDGRAVKMFWEDREGRPVGVEDYDFGRGQNSVKMA